MSNIAEIQEAIIAEFTATEEWSSRYHKIIELGKSLEAMPIEYKTEDNQVKGCQSQVWLHAELKNNKIL